MLLEKGDRVMKALILNSGSGTRMGQETLKYPKCMVDIYGKETIISRQLQQLKDVGINDVIITTGSLADVLRKYVLSLNVDINITFVHNEDYQKTNYIYSIYKARKELAEEDILLMHGDLVFENKVLDILLSDSGSGMVVSSTLDLPQKDFKAVLQDGRIKKIGIDFFDQSLAAQPLYKLEAKDFSIWLRKIEEYCQNGNVTCYAENAFNDISDEMELKPVDITDMLCSEIDTVADLAVVQSKVQEINKRTVYMSFAADLLHGGHINIIKKAARLGRVIVGVLTDEAVASYKRFPMVPFSERANLLKNLVDVYRVIPQHELSYEKNLDALKPDYVVHGDDWQDGVQKPVRDEVVACLARYGGTLVEFPYDEDEKYKILEQRAREEMSLPDKRRGRLKRTIALKGLITAIETHSGLTGLLAENTVVYDKGKANQFDAMWISSLCDSTDKGKPDIELVDMTSRFRTIDDIMEVTTKPIIFDADTGGLKEHFVYTVRTLERMGVSMVIIEDKTGLKKNSLFGTEVKQTQASIEEFAAKIAAGKAAQKSSDFMICARIESLILERGMDDALQRAKAFVNAGADAIMIHSRKKDPMEIFEFIDNFRKMDKTTPLVVVPTSFNTVKEEEFQSHGVNVVIYANHLMRAGFPAMKKVAETILLNHRSLECDDLCMPFKEIIRLIPADY